MFLRYVFLLCLFSVPVKAISGGVVEMQALGLMEGWDRVREDSKEHFIKSSKKYHSNEIVYKKSGFDQLEIEARKSKHKKKALSCYKGLLKRKPGAAGKVFFKFKVSGKSGKLKSLKVSPTHWADKSFKSCVNTALVSSSYESRSARDVTISYPLYFKSSY